jgi:cytochrome P450
MNLDAVTETEPVRPSALREFTDLPRPRGLPLLGSMLQIDAAKLHLRLEQWARKYGALFRFTMGRQSFLVVADHAVFQTVLRNRPDQFQRPLRSGTITREMGFDTGVFSANDDLMRRQRRMVMAAFDPSHVKAYFPAIGKVAQRLRERWVKAARAGAPIDLQADLMRFTVDTIAGLAFGAEINTLESDEDVIQRHLDKILPAIHNRTFTLVPYWRYFRLPADRRLDRSILEMKSAIADFIAHARTRIQADSARREHPHDLLEAMIVAADRGDSGLDDRDVAGNVLTMLLAGEDTTANTLTWMIYLLKRNPEALACARDEVRRVVGDPSAMTLEQIGALDYVEACAQETMRLKPAAPLIAAQAIVDTTVADVRVPARTVIFGVMRHDAMNDSYFPNPTAFLPERWLRDGEPTTIEVSAKRVSMPFGAGPRICPGRYLALLEMKVAMATLLGCFDLVNVETSDGKEPPELLGFTMAPAGLRALLSERT